jgi:hypothetical protein
MRSAPMSEQAEVRIAASRCCEVTVRGFDQCPVLDGLAAWARTHRYDGIEIVGLQWRTEFVPDPDPTVTGDEIQEYVVTMQFKTGAQQELNWGNDHAIGRRIHSSERAG